MIEKMGHIRNPLSVIAIFAALAEVSGTVVLPFIEQSVQQTYIWFLMGFPIALVLLFFATLNLNPVVLYAPSDYRDEGIFEKLFARASPSARIKQLEQEIEAAEQDDTPVKHEELGQPNLQPTTPSGGEMEKSQDGAVKGVLIHRRKKVINANQILERALLAEELAIVKVSKSLPTYSFERSVSLVGNKDALFDAVSIGRNHAIIIEVKFTSKGRFLQTTLQTTFNHVRTVFDNAPDNIKSHFLFVFVIVVSGEAIGRIDQMFNQISLISGSHLFKTRIEVFQFDDLKSEFQNEQQF